jgi:thymidylate kinase
VLIIVEAPDGAGKSTLVEKLVKRIEQDYPSDKVEVLKKGPPQPKSHPLDEYETPLLSYRPGRGHHIICDRWHVGEWVYPDVLHRSTKADRATWYHIELFLRSRGALVVYMDTPLDTMVQRVKTRGDDLIQPYQLQRLMFGYKIMREQAVCEKWLWKSDEDLSWVITQAWQLGTHAQKFNPYTTYIGPFVPLGLLIGDTRNGITGSADLRPAFMPYRATSGHYLFSALPRDEIRHMGFANACDVDDIDALMDALHFPPAVALGREAHRRLRGEVEGVPHPQFMRRFYNKHDEDYARIINRALHDNEEHIEWRP